MPPEGSSALHERGPAVWEALREEVGATVRLGHVFLVGDLNARTSTAPDFPGSISHPADEPFLPAGTAPVHTQRNSCDSTMRPNRWGRELLDLCCATGMRIANGRVPGDEEGQVTFVSQIQEGSSLIDYVLASPDALQLIQSLRVLPAPESDHSAVHLLIQRTAPQSPTQKQKRRKRPALQEPAPPEPPRMKGEAQLAAWQHLLEQPHVASDLFLIGLSADAATCAEDMHAIGDEFDQLIVRTQAEVLGKGVVKE